MSRAAAEVSDLMTSQEPEFNHNATMRRGHPCLKVGAHVSLSVRGIWVRCASGYPYQRIFARILANLRAHYMLLRI